MEQVAQWGPSYFMLMFTYYSVDQIKENEMGGACDMHGRGQKHLQDFGGKARRKKTT
jgi:hypothetical protein